MLKSLPEQLSLKPESSFSFASDDRATMAAMFPQVTILVSFFRLSTSLIWSNPRSALAVLIKIQAQ